MDDADPFDLRRFVKAQSGGTYEVAIDELRRGCRMAAGTDSDFDRLLTQYCDGERDELTVTMLKLQGAH